LRHDLLIRVNVNPPIVRSVIVLLLVLGGCADARPPSPVPSPTDGAPVPSASPSNPGTVSPSPDEPSGAIDLALEFSSIDQQYTTPAMAYTTDGTALLWSSGAPNGADAPGAANLWRYEPGGEPPAPIFLNPNPDSNLIVIDGDGSGAYAFVEQSDRLYQPAGWRLWYMADGLSPAVVIDEGDVADGVLPFFTLDRERLIWTVVHETGDGVESQLLMVELSSMTETLLASAEAVTRELLFPSAAGDDLVYSTITIEPTGAARSDVFLLDLADTEAPPRQLNTEPAMHAVIDGDTVVWQQPSGELHPLNGGPLVSYSLASGTSRQLAFPADDDLVIDQSVAGRYLTAEAALGPYMKLYLYDLEDDRAILVDDLGDGPLTEDSTVSVRPVVGGNLMVFVRGHGQGENLELKWARLPADEDG
jgi:hypothetical protein